jgi:hypothetical protein
MGAMISTAASAAPIPRPATAETGAVHSHAIKVGDSYCQRIRKKCLSRISHWDSVTTRRFNLCMKLHGCAPGAIGRYQIE